MNIVKYFMFMGLIFLGGFTMTSFASEEERDFHVTKVVINKPFNIVWEWVTNPLKFPEIYPNWVKEIKKTGENTYFVTTPSGWAHSMTTKFDIKTGTIDFDIDPGESSRSRIFAIGSGAVVHIHMAVKHPQVPSEIWEDLKNAVDQDYLNAKKVIEKQ